MDEPITEVKSLIERLGKAHQEYRETNDARLVAVEKGETAVARELDQKLDRINADLSKFGEIKTQIERGIKFADELDARIDTLEAGIKGPRLSKLQKAEDEHVEKFDAALRGRFEDAQANDALRKHQAELWNLRHEGKAVTIGVPAAGGYAVPEQIAREIEKLEIKLSPVRDLVKVVQTGTSDYKELVSIGGAASGWVGESDTRAETGTPQLREVTPTHGELYAYPQASEWSLDDAFFSIEQWLTEETAEEFALQEGIAVIEGDGVNKPTGMLNTTPTADEDFASPLRDAEAYQYIDSPASPAAVNADTLIDVVYALNSRYRAGASWAMNSATAGAVRKLKDAQGQYHWQPGLQLGEPDRLLGYPSATWENMPDVAANAFPIAFGNFRRGYLLVDRVGLRITVDQVTNPGFIRYYMRRREGGKPLNNDAIKFMRT